MTIIEEKEWNEFMLFTQFSVENTYGVLGYTVSIKIFETTKEYV